LDRPRSQERSESACFRRTRFRPGLMAPYALPTTVTITSRVCREVRCSQT